MGQPQGLPLQLTLGVLKRSPLGARASGPPPRPSRTLPIQSGLALCLPILAWRNDGATTRVAPTTHTGRVETITPTI